MTEKIKILVITPIKHIKNISLNLEKLGTVKYLSDPNQKDLIKIIDKFHVIFTNPNKSKIYLGENLLKKAKKLRVISTASTGTNHIDKEYAFKNKIKILSLTNELKIIKKISSTAELALTLTLASIRNILHANKSVIKGKWDYTKFIGNQINFLNIGVIGYGRLGSIFTKYCLALGAAVFVYDPYKKIKNKKITQLKKINDLLKISDVISIHIHAAKETEKFINKNLLKKMKKNVILINTSRGEIIDENDLVNFLKLNPKAKVGTDVLYDEIRNRKSSKLLKYSKKSNQVIITPHIGGMTLEAQEIAYSHSVKLLDKFLKKNQ